MAIAQRQSLFLIVGLFILTGLAFASEDQPDAAPEPEAEPEAEPGAGKTPCDKTKDDEGPMGAFGESPAKAPKEASNESMPKSTSPIPGMPPLDPGMLKGQLLSSLGKFSQQKKEKDEPASIGTKLFGDFDKVSTPRLEFVVLC
jgi:hypothetical protein